jgi:hypothetical protein
MFVIGTPPLLRGVPAQILERGRGFLNPLSLRRIPLYRGRILRGVGVVELKLKHLPPPLTEYSSLDKEENLIQPSFIRPVQCSVCYT